MCAVLVLLSRDLFCFSNFVHLTHSHLVEKMRTHKESEHPNEEVEREGSLAHKNLAIPHRLSSVCPLPQKTKVHIEIQMS